MPKIRKDSKRKNAATPAALKRVLRSHLKSARGPVARAEQLAADLAEIKADVGRAIEPIFAKLQEFDDRLAKMEENFAERVRIVADTIKANLRENANSDRRSETSSGTRKSAFERVADEGFSGLRFREVSNQKAGCPFAADELSRGVGFGRNSASPARSRAIPQPRRKAQPAVEGDAAHGKTASEGSVKD